MSKDKRQRVSDLIKSEDIKKWSKNNVVTIKAGLGMGKSYFIKNSLYNHAITEGKKILMLIHRSESVRQFKKELERDDKLETIDIMTYQKIDTIYQYGGSFNFSKYKYIVCDEFQYFMEDASFNKTTDISLRVILENKTSVKIFMSATGDYMQRYIKNYKKIETIDYELDINYDFIKKLYFFNQDETMERLTKRLINENKKAIFFIQSAEKAYELHKKFKDNTIFNCSESNAKYNKYVDRKLIGDILENEKFESNILITTTVMDSGVNIIDNEIKNIIIDVENVNTLTQCLGRRRIDWSLEDDGFNVFIKNASNNRLGGKITQLNKKLEKAKYFKDNGTTRYVRKYGRDPDESGMIYDCVAEKGIAKLSKKLNDLIYFKTILDIANTEHIIKYGYMDYIGDLFGKEYVVVEDVNHKVNLEEYLDSIVGKKLYKDYRDELINIIGLKDSRGRVQKSISQLNEYFIANKFSYIIISKIDKRRKLEDGSINEMRDKTFWQIINTEIK